MDAILDYLPPKIADIVWEYAFTYKTGNGLIEWIPFINGANVVSACLDGERGCWMFSFHSSLHMEYVPTLTGELTLSVSSPLPNSWCDFCQGPDASYVCVIYNKKNNKKLNIYACAQCAANPVAIAGIEKYNVGQNNFCYSLLNRRDSSSWRNARLYESIKHNGIIKG